MNKKLTFLLVMILFLTACSKAKTGTTPSPPSQEALYSQIIFLAREKLAENESVPIDQIAIENIEEVIFLNSCLDIISDGMECATVLTPGYKITLSLDGKLYVYHSNEEGTQLEMANSETNNPGSLNTNIPAAVTSAKQFLSNELLVKPTLIKMVSYEFRNWPDGCLGISEAGKMCIQVITPGYAITFDYEGQIFRVRTDQSGSLIKIDKTKPQPGVQDS